MDKRVRSQKWLTSQEMPTCDLLSIHFDKVRISICALQVFKHSSEWATVLQFIHFVAPTLGLQDAELSYLSPPALELGVLLPQKSVLLGSVVNGILKPVSSRHGLKKVTFP